MGGDESPDDNALHTTLNLVLLGKVGNGKSATGNSILGNGCFRSKKSFSSVTSTCQLGSVQLSDSRIISVIDTPGLLESSEDKARNAQIEVCKCISLARTKIHSLILVLSARNRFTMEEMEVLESLKIIFGESLLKYLMVVFTGGDEYDEDELRTEEFTEELREILEKCDHRTVLFDNKTNDIARINRQREKLLSLVDGVLQANNGQPYTSDLFEEAQKLARMAEGYFPGKPFRGSFEFHKQQALLQQKIEEKFMAEIEKREEAYKESERRFTELLNERQRERLEYLALADSMKQPLEELTRLRQEHDRKIEQQAEEQRKAKDDINHLRGSVEQLKSHPMLNCSVL